MIKAISAFMCFALVLLGLNQIPLQVGGSGFPGNILSESTFIDDQGNKIQTDRVINRIISLSPTHTENLFTIGGGQKVIGVDSKSIFPYEAAMLPHYRLDKVADVEAIIAASPDIILIEPTMNSKNSSVVSAFESAGIQVVSILPKNLEDFGYYIEKLGMLSGQEDSAVDLSEAFYNKIQAYRQTNPLEQEGYRSVFIETSEKGYQTITQDSLVGQAVALAGGKLITPHIAWYMDVTDRVDAGESFIVDHDKEIDSYISLQGDGNSGASMTSLSQKEALSKLQAVESGHAYEVQNALLGRFTFRYCDGINELNRLLYGDQEEWRKAHDDSEPLSRIAFAHLVYEALTLPTYTLNRTDYYEYEKFHHTYGAFEDVNFLEADFKVIETVVMYSYLLPIKDGQGNERFDREGLVSEEDLRHFLYIWQDLRDEALDERLMKADLEMNQIKTVGGFTELLETVKGWHND